MLCPVCKGEVVVTGQAKLETLNEHVSCMEPTIKDKYECSNNTCPTKGIVFWNQYGELYTSDYGSSENLEYIDSNDAPFGSITRKLNVESYKHDEDWYLYEGKKFRIARRYSYKANKDGEVVSKKGRFELSVYRDDIGGYVHYISGLHMLIFSIKQYHRTLKECEGEYSTNFWAVRELRQLVNLLDWEKKDWWRRWSHYYMIVDMNLFHRSMIKTILDEEK